MKLPVKVGVVLAVCCLIFSVGDLTIAHAAPNGDSKDAVEEEGRASRVRPRRSRRRSRRRMSRRARRRRRKARLRRRRLLAKKRRQRQRMQREKQKSAAAQQQSAASKKGGQKVAQKKEAANKTTKSTDSTSVPNASKKIATAKKTDSSKKKPAVSGAATIDKKATPKVSDPSSGPTTERAVSGLPHRGHHALDVTAGVSFFSRQFRYKDALSPELRPYSLPLTPAIDLRAVWFPGSHYRKGFWSHIGVDAMFRYAPSIKSQTSEGTRFPTNAYEFQAHLVGRIPLWKAALTLRSGYALQAFTLKSSRAGDATPIPAAFPSVIYNAVRNGLDIDLPVARRFSLQANFAHRYVISFGKIQNSSYFPNATGGGIDVGGGVAFSFLDWLEARASVAFTHYFYDMKPEPGVGLVAGGATDQYLSFMFGVAYRHAGVSR